MIANVDLVASVLIIFLMVRLQARYQLTARLLCGIKCFITKQYSDFVRAAAVYGSTSNKKDDDEIPVDFFLTQLNLSMMQISPSSESLTVLKSQPFYRLFDTLLPFMMGSTLSHLLANLSHCVFPGLESTSWISVLVFIALLMVVQILLQMVFLTGFRVTEMKIGLGYTLFVTIILALLNYRGISMLPSSTIEDVSIHVNSLLMQLSANPPTLPVNTMNHIVKYAYMLVIAMLSFSVIIPAFRFTQTLIKMSLGKKSERLNKLWITFLWADLFYPVIIVVVFSPLFINYMNCISALGNVQSCPAESWRNENTLIFIQSAVITVYGSIKLASLKKHLQSFMDFSVETVSHIIMSKDENVRQALREVIEGRSRYLISAAAQHLSVPIIFWSLLILFIRSKPLGTGLCIWFRSKANIDNTELYTAAQHILLHNTTQLAVDQASSPYFEIAFWRAMGAIEKMSKNGEKLPAGALMLKQFAVKMTQIFQLPVVPSSSLLENLIFHFSLIWLGMNLVCILIWLIYPESVRSTVATPKYRN